MDLSSLPNTAEMARALGLKFYYPGKPCRHGHESARYSNRAGGCVACNHVRLKDRSAPAGVSTPPVLVLRADWRVVEWGGE